MAIEIFFSYAHEDEDLMNDVRRQMVVFERQGKIVKWHDRQIPPGDEWEKEIDHRLRSAQVILLFVSPAFLESRYCYDVEVVTALERHQRGEARVIPVVLRPCAWEQAPFAMLQALPKDAVPLVQWPDRDQVCLDVARAVVQVAEEVRVANVDAGGPESHRSEHQGEGDQHGFRRKLQGDRISRILIPFTPPTAINAPEGYQPRLTRIAARVYREQAVRHPRGGFSYPAQFRGELAQVASMEQELRKHGFDGEIWTDTTEGVSELWLEYRGGAPPQELRALARANGLEVVHCGAWLLGSVPTQNRE